MFRQSNPYRIGEPHYLAVGRAGAGATPVGRLFGGQTYFADELFLLTKQTNPSTDQTV